MLARLTIQEYREWEAFYQLHPWGEPIEDQRLAVLCQWLMRPHLKKASGELPSPMFPYFRDVEAEYRQREALQSELAEYAERIEAAWQNK